MLFKKKFENRKSIGATGEEAAVKFMTNQGFKILDRNFRCPLGELDIVARKLNILAFIEVKSRISNKYGAPQLAVTTAKKKRIIRLAQYYIKRNSLEKLQIRFDVIAVKWDAGGNISIEHFPAAFSSNFY